MRAPDLQGLTARVSSPLPPGAEELVERLHQKLRALAPRREREAGEPVAPGDEVECDLLAVVGGQVLPGSAQRGVLLELRPFAFLPGLVEGMVGMPTFSARTLPVRLPHDYPLAEFAGVQANYYVEVRRAFAVEMPALDDPDALRASGLGADLEQAMASVAAEIDAEQGEELLAEATRAVLDQFAERVPEGDLQARVEQELNRRWQETDGDFLREKEFSPEMVERARRHFVSDPELRRQTLRQLKLALGLTALIEEQRLAPDAESVNGLLDLAAETVRASRVEIGQALRAEPDQAAEVLRNSLYLKAVEFVMARARVEVV